MNGLNKSVKILGKVLDILMGENFTSPMQIVMNNHPYSEFPYGTSIETTREQPLW